MTIPEDLSPRTMPRFSNWMMRAKISTADADLLSMRTMSLASAAGD